MSDDDSPFTAKREDIVERLREWDEGVRNPTTWSLEWGDMQDAADEIERLRAEVRDRDIRLGNTERHLAAERLERIAAEAQRDRLIAAIEGDDDFLTDGVRVAAAEVRAEMEER